MNNLQTKSLLLIVLSVLLLGTALWAMPPSPDVLRKLQTEGRLNSIIAKQADARSRGVDEPFDFALANSIRRDDEIELRAVCILVDFDNNEADQEVNSVDHFQSMLFSRGEYETGSMRDFYLENSKGQVHIVGQVFGWYRMPNDYEYYVGGQNGFGEYPENAQGLTEDALAFADEDIDFSEFVNSDDDVVEALFIVHAGPGAEATGSNDDIWSHAWQVPGHLEMDGVSFDRYAMEPEDGNIGVFGHELGHSLFGLPDLYDRNYESAGVGLWSMMAGGSWGGGGYSPAHFDAWSKIRCGFIEPVNVEMNTESLVLNPIETDSGEILRVWNQGSVGSQYFLVENRQNIGFDVSIPGSGLLIWHIDENMEDNDSPWWPGVGRDRHYLVALEQADGSYDMEHNRNSGDAADPWTGIGDDVIFNRDSEPDSRSYIHWDTEVTMFNFEILQDRQAVLDVDIIDGVGPEKLNLFLFERIPEDHVFIDPDDRTGQRVTDEVSLVTRLLNRAGAEIDGHDSVLPENLDSYNAIIYLESWRDGESPSGGLTMDEQALLADFLLNGGKLILVGPDVATNLQIDDSPLWPLLKAEYVGEGEDAETGNMRIVRTNGETRLGSQSFIYTQYTLCDHYVDIVGPTDESDMLFYDDSQQPRGVLVFGENQSRIILQPFLFGGMMDRGGSKEYLMKLYFQHLRFYLGVEDDNPEPATPPQHYQLLKAWPNPFNSSINIVYRGMSAGAGLNVLDVEGRLVDQLALNPGDGFISWIPSNIPSGSYWVTPAGNRNNGNALRIVYIR